MTTAHAAFDQSGSPLARILYVEGDAFVSQVPSRFLVSCGCIVTVAHSAADAWCHCKPGQEPFDLIIADGDTPAMGGIDFVTRLRSIRYAAGIIVFLVSMNNDLIQGYEQLGVKGILKKPLELSDLRQCVEALGKTGGGSRQ
jgi:CheY-like chemotaxis protein